MAFEGLSEKLSGIFSRLKLHGKLTESDIKDAMREVRLALLEADVNYKVAKDFVASVSERAVGEEVMKSLTPAQQVIKIVNDELASLMGGGAREIRLNAKGSTCLMMCGLQGSGKTTHAAKLAKRFKSEGRRPLLIACDVYRPAAIEQLKIVGEAAGAEVFEQGQGDPVEIARKGYLYGRDYGFDVIIVDTAGRLQIDAELMDELRRIKEAVSVDETLLVVDSMTGQEAVNVAETFASEVGIDGIILTKLDGDTRGGAALSVLAVTGKPIKFAGTGEKLDDLEVFHPDRMASRILGMGDVLSFIEKAEKNIDAEKAAKLAKKVKKGFDMNDLLDQFEQLGNMGNIQQLVGMMPGGAAIPEEAIDEQAFRRTQAVILSMTPLEREKPSVIDAKRKRRIAAGCGQRVEDVNRLLRQFEQMNKMVKQMNKKGRRRMSALPGRGSGLPF
ncbi:MAG: signal recognition particle protein [Oscillospiraceae bacterium]|nr:signal recognition particle protein [Oscillospiraceae bacterium]